MKQVKATRGRPKGSGINDKTTLLKVAGLMLDNSELKPTTAIKQLGIDNPSIIRRLRDKFNETQAALMAEARSLRGSKTAGKSAAEKNGKQAPAKQGKGSPVKQAPVVAHLANKATVARFAIPVMKSVPASHKAAGKLGAMKSALVSKTATAGKAPVANKSANTGKAPAAAKHCRQAHCRQAHCHQAGRADRRADFRQCGQERCTAVRADAEDQR